MDEETICRIFGTILGLEAVGRNDHFIRLGGHSIQAVRLVAAIQNELQVELPVRSVLRHPTPAGLAAELTVARERKSRQATTVSTISTIWFDHIPWAHDDWPSDLPVTGKSFPKISVDQWTPHLTSDWGRIYFDYLRELPPETPLLVGGFCRIGLMAFEAACQLAITGRAPAGIVLVDTPTPSWLVRCGRSIAMFLGKMLGASPGQTALRSSRFLRFIILFEFYFIMPGHKSKEKWKRVLAAVANRHSPADARKNRTTNQLPKAMNQGDSIQDAHDFWQVSDLTKRQFNGPVLLLFSQETPAPLRRHITRGWAKFCPNLIVDETPGDHASCVREHAGGLAQKIAKFVRALQIQK